MNTENDKIEDAREATPEVTLNQRKTPGFGPGFVNLAIPDRGHVPSCLARDFKNAEELNTFCEAHPDWLTVFFTRSDNVLTAVFQTIKSDLTQDEMREVSRLTEEGMAKFRKAREEQEAAIKKQEAERQEAEDECRRIGRLCIENHGAFVKELPGLSKLKGVRKSIADDILLAVQKALEAGLADEEAAYVGAFDSLKKILDKYVKEGAK